MKRYFRINVLLYLGLLLGISACSSSPNLKGYADLKEYIVKTYYSDNHQIYAEAIISNNDKQKLLTKFKFGDDLLKLKGKIQPTFLTQNPNYLYYVNKDDRGPYGYIIYALEKSGNVLIIYELFGD